MLIDSAGAEVVLKPFEYYKNSAVDSVTHQIHKNIFLMDLMDITRGKFLDRYVLSGTDALDVVTVANCETWLGTLIHQVDGRLQRCEVCTMGWLHSVFG